MQYGLPEKHGLYDPANEKDACGVGFVAQIKGVASHQIVKDANRILCNMDHRGARGSETNTGDGAGMLTALPDKLLRRAAKEELGIELPEPGTLRRWQHLPADGRRGARVLQGCVPQSDRSAGTDASSAGAMSPPIPTAPTSGRPRSRACRASSSSSSARPTGSSRTPSNVSSTSSARAPRARFASTRA